MSVVDARCVAQGMGRSLAAFLLQRVEAKGDGPTSDGASDPTLERMSHPVPPRRAFHPVVGALAWLAGVGWHLHQAAWVSPQGARLAVVACVSTLAVFAMLTALNLARTRLQPRGLRLRGWMATWLVCMSAGFVLAHVCTESRRAQRLQTALEGEDVLVVGVVSDLPRSTSQGTRFAMRVQTAHDAQGRGVSMPEQVLVGWYVGFGESDGDVSSSFADAEPPHVRAGERWRMVLRVKRPHASVNPHGRLVERVWFENGVGALASVRKGWQAPERLGVDASLWVERFRQRVKDTIDAHVRDPRAAGVLTALTIGEQAAIDARDWDVYRTSGVAHLMSISGLHITMFAWLAATVTARAWRRSAGACLWLPAPSVGRWAGLVLASLYVLVSGLGVPAQRTCWMLAAVTVLPSLGVRWPWTWVMSLAAVVVTAWDPWALLQPGFWLSFVAVSLLLARGHEGTTSVSVLSWTLAWLREQGRVFVGLAPLTLICFQQLSLVGLVANVVAIPWVTLVVTPLALVTTVNHFLMPSSIGAWLSPSSWQVAALTVHGLDAALAQLASLPWAAWQSAAAPVWAWPAALLASLLASMRWPTRWRLLAVVLVVPVVAAAPSPVREGAMRVTAWDVGQGTSVLVQTRMHALVFDTGPSHGSERDAGERVLVPELQAMGVRRVDRLVLSHRDSDHVGGALSLMRAVPVAQLSSSLHAQHSLRHEFARRVIEAAHEPCLRGHVWTWDGVRFEFLHPASAAALAAVNEPSGLVAEADSTTRTAVSSRKPKSANSISCVLRVQDASGHAVLLTGDVEAAQEAEMVRALPREQLRADTLLVAHHGSRTSSTDAWLDAVAPRWAVIQAGYRNRFGHPAPDVQARIESRGIEVVRTDRCGAWVMETGGEGSHSINTQCMRDKRRWLVDPH